MGSIAETERLLGAVVRLRRAGRASPAAEDISTVRAELERMIGPTVTRAMAARALGVSQTALDRWIASGDIPVVVAESGRREVPVHALAELVEGVEERAGAGAESHPLAAVLRERRAHAQRLDPKAIVPRRRGPRHGHRQAELRGLAYHRAVAQQLDEQTVADARHRLRRWRAEDKIDPRYADEWERILSLPIPRIAGLIGRDDDRMRALRQTSPLTGSLNEPTRRRVLELVNQ